MSKRFGVVLCSLFLAACGGGSSKGSGGANLSSSSSLVLISSSSSVSVEASSSQSISSQQQSSSSAASSSIGYPAGFALGADISWVSEMESNGYKFYNAQGDEKNAYELMASLGLDAIRLRVWVSPANGWYNSIQDVVAKASRAKAQGQRVMINFHYSDNWADPGKQTKPALWRDYTVDQLKVALAEHTRATLIALRDAGVTPEWVQVGNETNDGFLWDSARPSVEPTTVNMKNYADLTTAGYDAIKEIFPEALVIVHLANCHDAKNFRWIFDGLTANNARFDVIGASSYPTYSAGTSWQVITQQCADNLNDMVVRYQKPVILAEMGVPWDHAEGRAIIADLIAKVALISNGKGLGAFYWEPQAYNWQSYSLGAFDRSGKPTDIMKAFSDAAALIPK